MQWYQYLGMFSSILVGSCTNHFSIHVIYLFTKKLILFFLKVYLVVQGIINKSEGEKLRSLWWEKNLISYFIFLFWKERSKRNRKGGRVGSLGSLHFLNQHQIPNSKVKNSFSMHLIREHAHVYPKSSCLKLTTHKTSNKEWLH